MTALRLKPDTRLRKAWFVEEAMSHPAKLHIGLFQEILARLELKPGAVLLDPMAGIGTCLLACQQGITVVAVEMETHFLEPMLASWLKMQAHGPQLGHQMGQAVVLRGDARALPLASADAIVTSPPYEGIETPPNGGSARREEDRAVHSHNHRPMRAYTRPVSAVVTSPPYEEGLGHGSRAQNNSEIARSRGIHDGSWDYVRPVDAVVTSPPYEDYTAVQDMAFMDAHEKGRGRSGKEATWAKNGVSYSIEGSSNIGNLRGNRYWEAMAQVYRECHRVLIPGGVMVLVVKGYTRDKKYVDLPGQTADLIEALGFEAFDRWEREVPLSFWRTLQKANGNWDEALRFEHVIAARKPL